ncbi:MAG: sulfurtransferase TusA family protein [bacterium]
MNDKNENTIDARGLSCPQPVILTRRKIKEIDEGEFTVLVDNEIAKNNVIRAAAKRGWTVSNTIVDGSDFLITFKK